MDGSIVGIEAGRVSRWIGDTDLTTVTDLKSLQLPFALDLGQLARRGRGTA
jgi:hypothetical protein